MDSPERIDANAVIDRMREVLEVATDIALCAVLGVGSSVVSTWRRRNSVPYAECVNLAQRKSVSLDWLVLGRALSQPDLQVAEPEAPPYGDPRVARMLRFIEAWPIGRDSDDVAWLERQLARNVQEYGQWLASQSDTSRSMLERQDKPGP